MNTIFAREPIDWDGNFNGSCFLAGPTPRDPVTPSWRKDALEIFEKLEFKGIVLLPEERTWKYREDYNAQVEWEFNALTAADLIMFWIPRELTMMPAFTTNVEFGWWMAEKPSKVLLGSPEGAPKMTYLNWHADRLGIKRYTGLEEMIRSAIDSLSNRLEVL